MRKQTLLFYKNCDNMKNFIINNILIITSALFLTGCTVRDMNFTFDNKTNTEVDSIQVKVSAYCPQCPQIETVRKIPPYEKTTLTVTPFDDIKSDGEVSLILFYDSFKKEFFFPGYFSNGKFPSDTFGSDKLNFSIIERDTGLTIVNNLKLIAD